jgi:hypothetical protein
MPTYSDKHVLARRHPRLIKFSCGLWLSYCQCDNHVHRLACRAKFGHAFDVKGEGCMVTASHVFFDPCKNILTYSLRLTKKSQLYQNLDISIY